MDKHKMFFKPRMIFNFVFLYIFAFSMFFYNIPLAILQFSFATVALVLFLMYNNKTSLQFKEYIETLSFNIESATHNSVLKSPFPMVIIKENGEFVWYNNYFGNLFENGINCININDVFEEFRKFRFSENEELKITIELHNRTFEAIGIHVEQKYANDKNEKSEKNEKIFVFYFIETTNFTNLTTEYRENMVVKGLIYIDNLDEITKQISDSERTALTSHIEKKIADFIVLNDGILNKFDRDRYSFIIERKNFDKLKESKFAILKEVKLIDNDNIIPVTLSIGVGVGESLNETESFSRAALDMALGRGGDQAVIKEGNDFFYYGGQNKETEKRAKVRSRIIALSFKELLETNDKIIIMGHKRADMDMLGSALALARVATSFSKKAYIVIDENNSTTEALFKRTQADKEYEEIFITPTQAEMLLDNKTLITIVDTHREALVSAPNLLKENKENSYSIFIIDHHRKGADFIKNTQLTFHEPYASSTCELVVEMLQYLDNNVKLKRIEAEALYAGILIDTQNFTLRTGIRTFEAASYLRKIGMEPLVAKELIKHNHETYVKIAEIVKNAEMYNDIAIAKYYGNEDDHIFIAQAADDLVTLKGINASFVIFKKNDDITISARSNGAINVQLIMEKLGGGGHQLVAGTQLKDTTVDKAIILIKQALDEREQ